MAERAIQLKAANRGLRREIADRKEVESALEKERQIVQLLRSGAEAASSATGLDPALQFTLNHVCTHVGWPLGCAYRVQDATNPELSSPRVWYVRDTARLNEFQELTDATVNASRQGWISRALQTKQVIWLEDLGQGGNFLRAKVAKASGIKTGLIAPVFMGQSAVAVLEFFSTETKKPDARLCDAMQQVGIQLARIFERDGAQNACAPRNDWQP